MSSEDGFGINDFVSSGARDHDGYEENAVCANCVHNAYNNVFKVKQVGDSQRKVSVCNGKHVIKHGSPAPRVDLNPTRQDHHQGPPGHSHH